MRVDDELTLPGLEADMTGPRRWAWGGRAARAGAPGDAHAVVSTALATRDFQDVHHDRDLAVERGSKDIFLNILTTTGLVQRYVTDWAGPEAWSAASRIRLGVPGLRGRHADLHRRVTGRRRRRGPRRRSRSRLEPLGDHVTGTVTVALAGGAA